MVATARRDHRHQRARPRTPDLHGADRFPCDPGVRPAEAAHEGQATYGAGWVCGTPNDYDREYCVDLAQLSAFLRGTQPEVAEPLDLAQDTPRAVGSKFSR